MGTRELEAFVERALFLDRDDPVAAWGELRDFQAGLISRLAPAHEIRIQAEGTDLTLDVSDRVWINSDGKRNMPSGEVFTGPHEHSAEGVIRFTIPTSPRGVVVEDVTLEFRAGRVVSAHAERGDAYLQATLETDQGARYLGELGIGTNFGIDRPIGAILFDEKIGGTVHLALGRSYPETGGTNESVVHWDLICDLREGGTLTADGDNILRDGRFT
jgi:aminopeptidase